MKILIKIIIYIQFLIVLVTLQNIIIDTNGFSYINGKFKPFYELNDACIDNKFVFVTFLFNTLTYGQYNGCLNVGREIINNAITSRLDIINIFLNIYDRENKIFDVEKICVYEKNIKVSKLSLTGNLTLYLFCSRNKILDITNQPHVKSPFESKKMIQCSSANTSILCKEGSCGMYQRIINDRKKNISSLVKKTMCAHQIISFLYTEIQNYGSYFNFNESIMYASQKCSYYSDASYTFLDDYTSYYWWISCYNYSINRMVFPNFPNINNTNDPTKVTRTMSTLSPNYSSHTFLEISQAIILFTFLLSNFIL